MEKFRIFANNYLEFDTIGYYNCYYYGYGQLENPDFLNHLKNSFNNESEHVLRSARKKVEEILCEDIPEIMRQEGVPLCTLVCVPRSKAIYKFSKNQQFFQQAVSRSADMLESVIDGAYCIKRKIDTKMTHIKKVDFEWVSEDGTREKNEGSYPYPGITLDTCSIEADLIKNKMVILIDDIYTKTCNIDEDCIQALYDLGAKKIIFYAVAYTKERE